MLNYFVTFPSIYHGFLSILNIDPHSLPMKFILTINIEIVSNFSASEALPVLLHTWDLASRLLEMELLSEECTS